MISLSGIPQLPTIDRVKAYIVAGFSALVGVAFLVSLGSMVYFRLRQPQEDIGLWVNVFLTCLGYIVGILTGLLGIPTVNPPNAGAPPASAPSH